MLKITNEMITPKKARELLKMNTNNRPVRETVVESYSAEMRAGTFKGQNGETIKLNCSNLLVDGQHRLYAIIRTGIAQRLVVVRGVADDAFDTIDTGTSRGTADIFARRGETNYVGLAAAVRALWEHNGGAGKFRSAVAIDVLNDNPELRGSVQYIRTLKELKDLRLRAGVSSAMHYLMQYKTQCKMRCNDGCPADHFWSRLATGEELPRSSPIYTLRKKLIQHMPKEKHLTHPTIKVYTIKAWNAYAQGKSIKRLTWNDKEGTPELW